MAINTAAVAYLPAKNIGQIDAARVQRVSSVPKAKSIGGVTLYEVLVQLDGKTHVFHGTALTEATLLITDIKAAIVTYVDTGLVAYTPASGIGVVASAALAAVSTVAKVVGAEYHTVVTVGGRSVVHVSSTALGASDLIAALVAAIG